MCDFISWYEEDGAVIFLTDDDLETKEGKELRKYLGDRFTCDIYGHGAIKKFYELKGWGFPDGMQQKECNDFSTPNNFPPQIIEAIKSCNLIQIGRLPNSVLLPRGIKAIQKDKGRQEADAKREEADAKWQEADAKRQEAYAKRQEADVKWQEADANAFWKVFADTKNRKKVWR